MFPADLDDEQRAHFAHEHPNDLDSSPSSPSSGTPTFLDPRRRSKSASHHRSRSTADGSSSSSLLARLISREEEVREINSTLVVTNERLEAESSRANAAERRALDYFHRLRIATENRERAEQESARLREELKLYKLQLDNAQKEIFRAQDIIDQVAAQRNEAEAEAARARTKARKLQEEKLVMLAREEGRRMGYEEGLSIGRRIAYDQELQDGDETARELDDATDEERDDPRSHSQLRSAASIRQQPMHSESASPGRPLGSTLQAPPPPIPPRTPSHERRTPSPPDEPDEPETIRPIPIRPTPTMATQPISVPIDDGWIPRADSRTSYISMPHPYELQRPVSPSPSSVATESQARRRTPQQAPTPVPPPVRSRDYAYQTSVPPPVPHGHAPSIASRTSTHISQYDLVNKRPGSSLRNEIYAGRARSGSQPSRANSSRNEHRDQERRHSSRTEAENIIEQWRADSDASNTPPNPPRSFTPSAVPHPYRPPPHFYYRPREIVMPTPLGDDDTRTRTPVPTESTATRPHPLPDDSASHPAPTRSPLDYLRKRFRPRPGSGSSGIPDIVVESPSEPETTMSPATTAAHPDLLSPEAANRPLPRDDQHQHQHQHHHHHNSHSQSQSQPHQHQHQHHQHHRHPPSAHDTTQRSGTYPWPAGFVPYPPGHVATSTASSSKPERDRDHHHHRRAHSNSTPVPVPVPAPGSNSGRYTNPNSDSGRSQDGYSRTRTQNAGMGRTGRMYETAPLPPGVTYPVPPTSTSQRQYRTGHRDENRERDRREWDRERDRERRRDSVRGYERERERDRVWHREREQDPEDTGSDEEHTHSPAPLQRPISLFDSDEA